MAIDLHTHSTSSDGTVSPAELVRLADALGLSVVALTDHDTVNGVAEAVAAAEGRSVTVIPGTELSSLYEVPGTGEQKDIHILGYQVDYQNPEFLALLERFAKLRGSRNEKMLDLLDRHGLTVDREEFYRMYEGSVIGRAHMGEYLYRKGYVGSMEEAFARYIGDDGPCFVQKQGISCKDAIDAILLAGGYPVLAHPPQYKLTDRQLRALVEELISYGLEGIEAIYSTYTQDQERNLRALAREYELHITGGSDYHGAKKPDIHLGTGLGRLCVPDGVADWLMMS